ncbi:MAG: DUF596 domain-containing protein [Variovorax sp.]|nr:MAG: DUF596 domain-containing protein [Variovorax sp.]
MFSDVYIERFLKEQRGTSLVSLWLWSKTYPPFFGDLEKAKQGFFFLAQKLMSQGQLKLARDGVFMEGSIEAQLQLFKDAWPCQYDENVDKLDIDNLWWLLYAPAGAVWIYPDGYQQWT